MDIASGQVGPEDKWSVDLVSGKVVLVNNYVGLGGSVDLTVKVDAGYLLDELAKKIPGQIDDAVFGLLKAALAKF